MSKSAEYDRLFTFSKDAQPWSDPYERPTKLFHHHMAMRRDAALEYTRGNFAKDARILDLGCGAGVVLERLVEEGFRPNGVDPSNDMLALARRRLERFDAARYHLQNANIYALPFADEEFDLVLCMGVFGYLDDVDGALKEIRRVLKPGAPLLMSIRNATNLHVFDPCVTVRLATGGAWRFLKQRVLRRSPRSGPKPFRIDIQDKPRNVIRGVVGQGFELASFEGFGFGPLSICRKQVFPLTLSIRLSDALTWILSKLGLSAAAAWVADVSMYAFKKT